MDITSLFNISYGIYYISAEYQGQKSACLVNTVFQLTAEPIRVAVSVSKQNQTHDTILNKGSVAGTVVGTEAETANLGLLGYRTGREVDKFAALHTKTDCLGNPVILDDCVSYFSCKVEKTVDLDTHTVFICSVEDGEVVDKEAVPMTYNYYRQVKKLKSSKFAPTYVDESK